MLFCNIFLLNKEFNNSNFKGYDLLNNKVFLILLIISLIISSSILFSGSRSGLILLIISMIICCYKFSKFFSYKKLFILKSASRFVLIICPLLFFIFYTFGKDPKHKEMLTNSISQWQNFLDGKPPLRFLLWKDTVEMINHKPLWGWGYKSFSSIYPKYQSSASKGRKSDRSRKCPQSICSTCGSCSFRYFRVHCRMGLYWNLSCLFFLSCLS